MKSLQKGILLFMVFLLLVSCQEKSLKVMTVNGWFNAGEMGVTLPHEHIMIDWSGADSIDYDRWDKDSIVMTVLPYLKELKDLGCQTLIDCTPSYMGRDPEVFKKLSDESGLHIIFGVGLYGAINNRFVPRYAYEETAEQLAERWLEEWESGCRETGIIPGIIKVGVDYDTTLTKLHAKLVRAGCLAHLGSGMTVAVHSGPAERAYEILQIFREEGVAPEAFVWTHALLAEKQDHVKIGKTGAWVSFDKVNTNEEDIQHLVDMITNMNNNNLLNRVLLSHDAGWYTMGQPRGGGFRPYTPIFTHLIPALREHGFTQEEIDQMMIKNPAEAYAVRIRKAL
jgi:phosphotriesterase-related protein